MCSTMICFLLICWAHAWKNTVLIVLAFGLHFYCVFSILCASPHSFFPFCALCHVKFSHVARRRGNHCVHAGPDDWHAGGQLGQGDEPAPHHLHRPRRGRPHVRHGFRAPGHAGHRQLPPRPPDGYVLRHVSQVGLSLRVVGFWSPRSCGSSTTAGPTARQLCSPPRFPGGFIIKSRGVLEPQVLRVIDNCRPDRQTVMFSATFPRWVCLIRVMGFWAPGHAGHRQLSVRPPDGYVLRHLSQVGLA